MQNTARIPALHLEVHHIYLAAMEAPPLTVQVQFIDEASTIFCAYRERYQFGASEMEVACGNIYNSRGELVGRISYNGRMWNAEGIPIE